jgi:hypothetical protein
MESDVRQEISPFVNHYSDTKIRLFTLLTTFSFFGIRDLNGERNKFCFTSCLLNWTSAINVLFQEKQK